MEVLFLLVQMKRELIRLQETMVIVQAIRDDEDGNATQKSFEKYRTTLMPFLKKELDEERKRIVKAIREESMKGSLQVKPMTSPAAARSKLRTELNKVKSASRFSR